jgi:hypothetical protein
MGECVTPLGVAPSLSLSEWDVRDDEVDAAGAREAARHCRLARSPTPAPLLLARRVHRVLVRTPGGAGGYRHGRGGLGRRHIVVRTNSRHLHSRGTTQSNSV